MTGDPTGTRRLRSAFRAELDRRVAQFLTALRAEVVDRGSFGPLSPVVSGDRLSMIVGFANRAIYEVVVSEGRWLVPHMRRAFASGISAGRRWSGVTPNAQVAELYVKQARDELEGIADATIQRVSRAAAAALVRGDNSSVMFRAISSEVRAVLQTRGYMLLNGLVVKQHNLGRGEQIKAMGVRLVGVIPEQVPRKRSKKQRDCAHAHVRDDELANVLTAGDDDVCPECEDYADDGPYPYEEVESTLPLHVNCRCAVVPFSDHRFATNVEHAAELEEEF